MNVSVPVIEPRAIGENVTPTVQFAPAAILPPHVLLATANGALDVMLSKLSATFRRLVTVTVLTKLVLPTAIVPKLNVLEESVTGVLPLPERLTVCGLFGASSVKVRVPVTRPVAIGENVTPTVQLAPVAMLAPHVLLATVKGPSVVMLIKFNVMFCRFVKVSVLAVLVLPTAVVLKLKLLVESVTGAVPVPERLTVCGLVSAVSVNVRTPVAEPGAAGVNVTPTVQFVPATMLAPQVLFATANGPVVVMLMKLSGTFKRFVTVTVLAEVVSPTAIVPKFKLVGERLTGALPLPLRAAVCVPWQCCAA